jgi:hypothetical protein
MRLLPLLVAIAIVGCAPATDHVPLHPATGQEHLVAASPDEVFPHLVEAYEAVGLDVTEAAPERATVWSSSVRHSILPLPVVGPILAPYVRCAVSVAAGGAASPFGSPLHGRGTRPSPLALGIAPAQLVVATSLHEEEGGTRMRTEVRASVRAADHCTSTGRLETRLLEAVESALAEAGQAE